MSWTFVLLAVKTAEQTSANTAGGIACHLWLQYHWAKIQSESLYTKHLRKLGDVSPRPGRMRLLTRVTLSRVGRGCCHGGADAGLRA